MLVDEGKPSLGSINNDALLSFPLPLLFSVSDFFLFLFVSPCLSLLLFFHIICHLLALAAGAWGLLQCQETQGHMSYS